ncbi:hypothetical protein PRK78_000338 [Emydomyces testavorans]|uniref:HNH nuclease domain-containing protein n=1 Tax=Emydomyces testavorans TaxID=2070801 RepID=A0AAF0IFR0_9EURO|nr:hypothetical protein PRK78_000338 [Emydomyces testavorans]
MASLHRLQSSLEGSINSFSPQSLAADQRVQAQDRFYNIINHFDVTDRTTRVGYSPPLLIRYTYEYSRSELSKDTFLGAFFEFMRLDITSEEDIDFDDEDLENQLGKDLTSFADFLLDNFFLPRLVPTDFPVNPLMSAYLLIVKASGHRTPQPSPAHLSVIQRAQGQMHEFPGTPDQISVLRGSCLIRDCHRCVISHKFDQQEAIRRLTQHGDNAQDDEGNPLQGQISIILEIAHILPHSLTQTNADSQLDESKKAALMILNMLDRDVSHLIDGINIDRPFNAMSLGRDLHIHFGNFTVFSEAVAGQEHTYRVDTFLPRGILQDVPVTRTLYLTDDGSIEPPSPRLLAIHCAIAHILHLSGAEGYIDNILRDMETGVQEDGSTELNRVVKLKLGGWLDGPG